MQLTSLNTGVNGKLKGVLDIERICRLCGVDRTPLSGGLNIVNDRRGQCLGLFGECCYQAVMQAVDESPRAYRWYPAHLQSNDAIREHLLARAREIIKKQ